jgi:hypothetical protein
VGVLLCLVAALVTLPALLSVYGRWRHARDQSERLAQAAVDRFWLERVAGRICRFPRSVAVIALMLTAVMGWLSFGIRFDMNILNLLPKDSEAVRYLRRMIEHSDLSPNFNIVVTDDLAALREVESRAAGEPTIGRFESVLRFLPEDPKESGAALAELGRELDLIRLPAEMPAAERQRLASSLLRVEEALADAAEAAFGAGMGELAGPLEDARAEAEGARRVVQEAPPGAERSWTSGEERLLAWASQALEELRRAAGSEPPGPEDLPPGLRRRFVSREGRLIAFIHPSDDIFDPGYLDRFVEASRRVSAEVTGFPTLFHIMSRRITSGFYRAVLVAAVLVFLILLADYRNLRETGLALAPLGMGVVWMMGAMSLLGIPFNFANLVAVPLIIGVGIDNGVHVIHRIRLEGPDGMSAVLRHTGRAILIASLTTMIGFGSLILASHRGLASLGTILILGVGGCLIASTVVLPNLLVAFRIVRR